MINLSNNTFLNNFNRIFNPTEYIHINGFCDDQFLPIKKAFAQIQPIKKNAGSALSVYHKGKLVVDIYTGYQDRISQQYIPWQPNTLSLNFSCGKALLATLVHILVSEGMLDYDRPIAEYWHQFAQNGKQHITLRHVLMHQSGLHNLKKITNTAADMLDWQGMLTNVLNMSPDFPVKQKTAYQAVTFGWIIGGVIEKVTQQSLTHVLSEKLLIPLNIDDDVFFGVPDEHMSRVARIIDRDVVNHRNSIATNTKQQPKSSHQLRQLKSLPKTTLVNTFLAFNQLRGADARMLFDAVTTKNIKHFDYHSDEVFQACIPSFNGTFTTKAMAKIYAMLANRGVWQGQRFINEDVFQEATFFNQKNTKTIDNVALLNMDWRLGYHKGFMLTPSHAKTTDTVFGQMGINGTMSWCDPQRDLAFSYVHTFNKVRFHNDLRMQYLSEIAHRIVC